MTSCIKENLPECIPDNTGIVLKFRYPTGTNTQSNKNGVDRLSVFIFDDKGIFVSQINDSLIWIDDNYELELPYKQGSYQFVTWAGYNEATYGITTCIPGQTHIEDFFLFLKRDTDNRVTDQPKLLYHGIHETVALDEHEKMIAWINLKQITNHIRVIAHNLDKDISHNIYIEDNNGKYDSFLQYADDEKINLENFAAGKIDCLLTCKKVSEGIDISSVTNIILFSSDRSRLVTTQRIGRALRLDKNNPEKKATVVDFVIEDSEENDNNADADRAEWLTELSQTRRCEHEK